MKHEITIQLRCHSFPGRRFDSFENVHLGVQRKQEIVEETAGDAGYKVFDLPVFFDKNKAGMPDFKGEFVHGKLGDRFLYLVWFDKKAEGNVMFRRAKISLQHLAQTALQTAIDTGLPIVAEISLTDRKGGPVCAGLKGVVWTALKPTL